jgi:uncharacterized protein YajQ (UPF0234 family)
MPTFDVVSQVDLQEVRNAVDQAARELATRFDFKGTHSTVEVGEGEITIESSTDHRLEAAVQVLQEKLVRRKVSLKALSEGTPTEVGGARWRSVFNLNSGLPQDAARELVKLVKETKLKVQVSIQGDSLRVQAKKRDDLQEVIAMLRGLDYRLPLQYVNYRD